MSGDSYGHLRILAPGIQSLVEDWPGRIGYYKYGYSVSGAADHYAHRMANLLVGNPPGEATIEVAGGMLEAVIDADTVIAICGADLQPTINDEPAPLWESIRVKEGDRLKLGFSKGYGFRAYIAFAGGIDVPLFFGSKSTCIYGKYGGYNGRPLQKGDVLRIGKDTRAAEGRRLKKRFIPQYSRVWEVRMIPGPTASPDFITEQGMERIYSTEFKIDRNSDRSGYRLLTPKEIFPDSWARRDGGAAGLHPSNLVDMGYPLPGGLNVCGDMIIILGPDGPCGGGFVVTGKVSYSDVWMVFQAVPGRDIIKFKYVSIDEAEKIRKEAEKIFTQEVIE